METQQRTRSGLCSSPDVHLIVWCMQARLLTDFDSSMSALQDLARRHEAFTRTATVAGPSARTGASAANSNSGTTGAVHFSAATVKGTGDRRYGALPLDVTDDE